MKPDGLRLRIAASRRVSLVAAAAMQRSARDILGVELSRDDAMALARAGDLGAALQALKLRLGVKRRHLSPEENLSLSVQEIALRRGGGSEAEVRELVRRTVEKARSLRESQRLGKRHQGNLEDLIDRYENESPQLRRFLRRIKRLWNKREMTVKLTIPDDANQGRAIKELNQLFADHIDEAVTNFGLQVSGDRPPPAQRQGGGVGGAR